MSMGQLPLITPFSVTVSNRQLLAFPDYQSSVVLYRLATWDSYKTLSETRRELITNIEYRDRIVLQIVSNEQKKDPLPLYLAGGGLLVGGFILGVLAMRK